MPEVQKNMLTFFYKSNLGEWKELTDGDQILKRTLPLFIHTNLSRSNFDDLRTGTNSYNESIGNYNEKLIAII